MRFKKGKPYAIRFWDHVIAEDEKLVECTAYGVVSSYDKDRVTLLYWKTHDPDFKHSKECTNIIRSTIISITELTD